MIQLLTWRRAGLLLASGVLVALCATQFGTAVAKSRRTESDAKPILVGAIGDVSGAISSTYGAVPKVLTAWQDTVNAQGGFDGRKVKVLIDDVGSNPDGGPADAQALIAKKVVAILDFDGNDTLWVKQAAAKSVPVIPMEATIGNLLTSDAYGVITSPFALAYGVVAEGKHVGSSMGLGYASDIPGTAGTIALTKVFAGDLKLNVPVASGQSSSAPDYTAFCQQLKGVASYALFFAASTAVNITHQCYAQGIRTPQLALAPDISPSLRDDKTYRGDYAIDGVAPFFDTAVPGVAEYRTALRKYEPSVIGSSFDDSASMFSWAGAELLSTVASTIEGRVTAASVRAALDHVRNQTLGGLVAPLTFKAGAIHHVNCWFLWQIGNGKFIASNGAKPTCVAQSVLAPLERQAIKSVTAG